MCLCAFPLSFIWTSLQLQACTKPIQERPVGQQPQHVMPARLLGATARAHLLLRAGISMPNTKVSNIKLPWRIREGDMHAPTSCTQIVDTCPQRAWRALNSNTFWNCEHAAQSPIFCLLSGT